MNNRLRFFGCAEDMSEYGVPVNDFNFPARFLQINKQCKTINDLKIWSTQNQLPLLQSKDDCWLNIPGSRQEFYFTQLSEKFPDLHLPEIKIKPDQRIITHRNKKLEITDSPILMGILNVTPDSFSDGGLFSDKKKAVEHALNMVQAGAQIIDVGGESTRPGAEKVTADEEWHRVGDIINQLNSELPENVLISVDTYKSAIAEKAMQNGASIINDISGLTFDPAMAEVAAQYDAPVIMMHIKGTPDKMQVNPSYEHVMDEVLDFFDMQINYALKKGVKQLILDPGVGFGKRLEDNFEIVRRFEEFSQFGFPTLLGLSRKSFMWRTLNLKPYETDTMSVMMNAFGVLNNANILRVHDIELHQQMKILQKLYINGKSK